MKGKLVVLIDKKWEIVKAHYEAAYRDPETKMPIRFRSRPKDDQIEYLYDQLKKLQGFEWRYLEDRSRDAF